MDEGQTLSEIRGKFSYGQIINNISNKWRSLTLDLLVPVKFSAEQWDLIVRARRNMADPQFTRAIPIVVADFKDAARTTILHWASSQRRTFFFVNEEDAIRPKRFVKETTRRFFDDISAIHDVLFDRRIESRRYDCEIGRFYHKRVGVLHTDGEQNTSTAPLYLARVGALPIEVVREEAMFRASKYERRLIALGKAPVRYGNPDDEDYPWAIERLRVRKLLTALPLNQVALALEGRSGTLHCSSEIPEGGAVSAFFRVSTRKPSRGSKGIGFKTSLT